MFNHFFTTQNNSNNKIKLFGDKQQQFTITLNDNQTIEYFQLDNIIESWKGVQSLKACDYVLVDQKAKKIMLCELKNSKDKDTIEKAEEQLRHSKHIVNLFLNILEKDGYLFSLLKLTNRKMNKQNIRTKQSQVVKYQETGKKEFKFNDLSYE